MLQKNDFTYKRLNIIDKLKKSKNNYEQFLEKNLKLLQGICNLEFCSINFITSENLESCMTLGMENFSIPKVGSLCYEAFNKKSILILNDISKDIKFKHNIFHVQEPFVNSYIGIPLKVDNLYIGTLCTYSANVSNFTPEIIEFFKTIAYNIEQIFTLNIRNIENIELNEKHLLIQEFSKAGTWELDIKSHQTKWSDEVYKIHAIEHRDSFDKNEAINFYSEHEREKLINYIDDVINDGIEYDDIFEFNDAKGNKKWVRTSGKPKYSLKGELTGIYGIFQDITNEIRLSESKMTAQKSFSRLQHTLEDFFIISKTDLEGTITFVNDNFCKISGYTPNELIGYKHDKVISMDNEEGLFSEMLEKLNTGQPWQGSFSNIAKNGEHYWVTSIVIPEKDKEGKVIGYTGMAYDISERMRYQQEVQIEKEKATFNSQLAAIGELSAGIAHEISNPLMVIYGHVSLLKDPNLTHAMQIKYLERIKNSVERINKISSGLLKVSRSSKDEDFNSIKVGELFNNFSEFYAARLENKDIKLIMDINDSQNSIDCNEIKMSQIFINLINNARDSIEETNPSERWIKIHSHVKDEKITFSISDSGPGIPEHLVDKVMNSFFTTKEVGKGNGLGLALVKRFIIEHRGVVSIEDIDGKNFISFTIPLKYTIDNVA